MTMPQTAYERVLRDLSSFFDSEKAGTVLFKRDDYELGPLRVYLAQHGALRPAEHVLHVGGTKGKGSVTTLASALLYAHGLSVGGYFSPHLVSFRERIRFDGRAVDGDSFAVEVGRVLAEKPDPGGSPIRSVFEALTAAAARLFAARHVDAAVFEVGLGGRLDATNVLETTVSVLTPISLDHTEVLGSTVEAIAADKAGILRPGRPAVFGPQSREALAVLLARAREVGARPVVFGRDMWIEPEPDGRFAAVFADGPRMGGLHTALPGRFQADNAVVALAACREVLRELDPEACREALATARIGGRLQEVQLADGGRVVLDGAHNPFAAGVVADEAERLWGRPLAVMVGVSSNKDVRGILEPLAKLADPLLLASFGGPRALPAKRLEELARGLGVEAPLVFESVEEAWKGWLALREQRPTLLATGSLFLVGRLLRVLHAQGRIELDPPPDPEPA
jgi:dihydrofolate synthase / folylpolyglutamate synthase